MSDRSVLNSWEAVQGAARELQYDPAHTEWLTRLSGATALRTWSVHGLPGALQTPRYYRAVRAELELNTLPLQADVRAAVAGLLVRTGVEQEHYVNYGVFEREFDHPDDRVIRAGQLRHVMRLMRDNGVGVRLIPPEHLHFYPWQSRWYNFRRTDHDNDEPYTVAESKIGFARLPDSREIFARVLQEAARYAMPQQETLAWLRRKAAELSK